MLKKFGMVTVGVTAGLLAVAPLASASECHDKDSDKGHHKSHDDHKSHDGHKSHGSQRGTGNVDCSAESGNASTENDGGVLQLGSIASGNAGQILSCNSFLNHNLDDNEVNILSAP